jgi:tRNA wybutosine-synthesizing protein 2
MGYYDAYEYLDAALAALAAGGTIHLHEATPDPLFPDRPVDRLRAAAEAADRSVYLLDTRVVKDHSAGVVHGVVDARIH